MHRPLYNISLVEHNIPISRTVRGEKLVGDNTLSYRWRFISLGRKYPRFAPKLFVNALPKDLHVGDVGKTPVRTSGWKREIERGGRSLAAKIIIFARVQ